MTVYTATERRPEIAAVWCRAIAATLQDPHRTVVCHQLEAPAGCAEAVQIRHVGSAAANWVLRTVMPSSGVRLFIEEDMIPVRPWSLDDYPGRLLYAEGSPGRPWPSFVLARERLDNRMELVPQRFVREGGCPDWLPVDLCEPALRANAKVLGQHFLHIDKMYRPEVPEAAAKNHLLKLLRQRFADAPPVRPGLGDMVSAGLSAVGITKERVQAVANAVGIKDCGCAKRQAALTKLGRKFGIG
jgi:hypothetical protein